MAALVIGLGGCSGGGGSDGEATQTSPITPPPVTPPPPGASAIAVTSPTSFTSSPVTIAFSVTNFTIGLPGTPHLRFSIDGGAQHDFYNGAGINSGNGVELNGAHDHSVHWTSANSFDLFALPAGNHPVRLALVDGSNNEVPGATVTHTFTVQQPPSGGLQLQSVLGALQFPVGLAQAPDGRIFYSERLSGAIRIINQGWQLASSPCVSIPVATTGEQGLLGLTLDPNFSSNHYLYVYYTVPGATMNRVVRYTESGGVCTNQTAILDDLPVNGTHNGGIIQFGPDGKLYVVIGDAEVPSNAQSLDSLAGKILRVNADGSVPSDNPFFSSSNANAKKVYSYGHRNSYGFTFHPANGQLWESENGPTNNDEVNRIVSGGNYGWDGARISGIRGISGYIDPVAVFNSVTAPTGIIVIPAGSAAYPPAYHNNLLVANFIHGSIHHLVLTSSLTQLAADPSVAYGGGVGGLLSFMRGSDGYIYVSSVDPATTVGGIYRVVVSAH